MSIDPELAKTDQPYVYANDDPLNAEDPLGNITCGIWLPGCGVITDLQHHWRGIAQGAGLIMGVVGAATGVGAVIELAAGAVDVAYGYGVISAVSGALATAVDQGNCSTANSAACIGLGLGIIDILTGVGALGAGASAVGISLTSVSASFGVATSVFDVTYEAFNPQAHTTTLHSFNVVVVQRTPMIRYQ